MSGAVLADSGAAPFNRIEDLIDWKNPQESYQRVLQVRWDRLLALCRPKTGPVLLRNLKTYYKLYPADFISDWGMTADQRNAFIGKPVEMPFILFPKQREWLAWVLRKAKTGLPGLTEKSRDCGVSWLAMCLSDTLGIFNQGVSIGFGSEKEDKLDRSADPDCLFWKAEFFLQNLPPQFRPAYTRAHMRIGFPLTGSSLTAEAGDNIGRGGRKSVYFVDEAAHIPHGAAIDRALATNTYTRIDMSSVKGMVSSFAQKRHGGKIDVFTFGWRDDPRKDDKWYERMKQELDEVALNQEVNMDYRASMVGQIIPADWVNAAIGACRKLGIMPSGKRRVALDVADEGVDLCAAGGRYGVELQKLDQWSGKQSDTYQTTLRAYGFCDEFGSTSLTYDADGLGAFVRGDGNALNAIRRDDGRPLIVTAPFHGSGAVMRPDDRIDPDAPADSADDRTNKDYFGNFKAQSWKHLWRLLRNTYRAVVMQQEYNPDEIISIAEDLPYLALLTMELCQPTYKLNTAGKMIVDKTPVLPDGTQTKSPNLADTVMMLYAPVDQDLEDWAKFGRM